MSSRAEDAGPQGAPSGPNGEQRAEGRQRGERMRESRAQRREPADSVTADRRMRCLPAKSRQEVQAEAERGLGKSRKE